MSKRERLWLSCGDKIIKAHKLFLFIFERKWSLILDISLFTTVSFDDNSMKYNIFINLLLIIDEFKINDVYFTYDIIFLYDIDFTNNGYFYNDTKFVYSGNNVFFINLNISVFPITNGPI